MNAGTEERNLTAKSGNGNKHQRKKEKNQNKKKVKNQIKNRRNVSCHIRLQHGKAP